ncbi:MAG: M56 family metallopeptidase [Planctomycetota bacterium]
MESLFDLFSRLVNSFTMGGLNSLWIGTALALAVSLLWKKAGKTNASTRFFLWWLALLSATVLSFLLSLPGSFSFSETAAAETGRDQAQESTVHPLGHAVIPEINETSSEEEARRFAARPHQAEANELNHAFSDSRASFSPSGTLEKDNAIPGSSEKNKQPVSASGVLNPPKKARGHSWLLGLLPMACLGIWVAVSFFLLMRLRRAYFRIRTIKQNSVSLDMTSYPDLQHLLRESAPDVPIQLGFSSEITFPLLAGLRDPMILFPFGLAERLTRRELEAVVRHEVAHLVRKDDWTKLLQKVLEAFFFFNPAFTFIGRKIDLERELACDDYVLEQRMNPTEYCRCLMRLAQLEQSRGMAVALGAFDNKKQIFQRFERLLKRRADAGTRLSLPVMVSGLAVFFATVLAVVLAAPAMALPLDAITFSMLSEQLSARDSDFDVTSETNEDNPGYDDIPCTGEDPSGNGNARNRTTPSTKTMISKNSRPSWLKLWKRSPRVGSWTGHVRYTTYPSRSACCTHPKTLPWKVRPCIRRTKMKTTTWPRSSGTRRKSCVSCCVTLLRSPATIAKSKPWVRKAFLPSKTRAARECVSWMSSPRLMESPHTLTMKTGYGARSMTACVIGWLISS